MGQTPPQVLVRVAPRLLGDALTVALREQGLSVHCCPEVERRGNPRPPRRYAVAVVTEALPSDVAAGEVIRIDSAGRPHLPEGQAASAAPAGRPGGMFEQLLGVLQTVLARVSS